MKQWAKFAISVTTVCLSCSLYATNVPSQQNVEQEIQTMQRQINRLHDEMNSYTAQFIDSPQKLIAAEARKRRQKEAAARGLTMKQYVNQTSFLASDWENPFELFSDTTFALSLLESKKDYAPTSIVFGGYFEADAQVWGGSFKQGTYKDGNGLYVTSTNLDTMLNYDNWFTGFASASASFNGNRSPATLSLEQGFLMLGNLKEFPIYAWVGKSYVPFGTFAGNGPFTNSMTRNAFRPDTMTQLVFGFADGKLNTNLSIFDGKKHLDDFSYGIFYSSKWRQLNYSLSAGYLFDTRYVNSGLGNDYLNNSIKGKRNSLIEVSANTIYKLFALYGEYVTSTESASFNNVSTGKMSSWVIAGGLSPRLYGKEPTSFVISFSQTRHMSPVSMPLSGRADDPVTTNNIGFKWDWIASVTQEVATNVYLGPEFQYGKLYGGKDTWSSTVDLSVYF